MYCQALRALSGTCHARRWKSSWLPDTFCFSWIIFDSSLYVAHATTVSKYQTRVRVRHGHSTRSTRCAYNVLNISEIFWRLLPVYAPSEWLSINSEKCNSTKTPWNAHTLGTESWIVAPHENIEIISYVWFGCFRVRRDLPVHSSRTLEPVVFAQHDEFGEFGIDKNQRLMDVIWCVESTKGTCTLQVP